MENESIFRRSIRPLDGGLRWFLGLYQSIPSGLFMLVTASLSVAGEDVTINLSWKDNSRIEDGYYIERQIAGVDDGFRKIPESDPSHVANTTSYQDSLGATPAEIRYRVYAWNQYGSSQFAGPESIVPPQVLVAGRDFELIVFADDLSESEGPLWIDLEEVLLSESQDSENQEEPDHKPSPDPVFHQIPSLKVDGLSTVSIQILPKQNQFTRNPLTQDQEPVVLSLVKRKGAMKTDPIFVELVVLDAPRVSLVNIDIPLWYESSILEIEVELSDGDSDLHDVVLEAGSDWFEFERKSETHRVLRLRESMEPDSMNSGGISFRELSVVYKDDQDLYGERSFQLIAIDESLTVPGLKTARLPLPVTPGTGRIVRSSNIDLLPIGSVILEDNQVTLLPSSEEIGHADFEVRDLGEDSSGSVVIGRLRVVPELFHIGWLQGVESSEFILKIGEQGRSEFLGVDPDLSTFLNFGDFWVDSLGEFNFGLDRLPLLERSGDTPFGIDSPHGYGSQVARDQEPIALSLGQTVGSFPDSGVLFLGQLQAVDGVTKRFAGSYSGNILLSPTSTIEVVAGHDGLGTVLLETSTGVGPESVFRVVQIDDGGQIAADLSPALVLNLQLDPNDRSLEGSAEYFGRRWDVVGGTQESFSVTGLSNLSLRAPLGGSSSEIIAGFVVEGDEPLNVLMRGVGPGLETFGIPAYLANPILDLRFLDGNPIGVDDDWGVRGDRLWLPGLMSGLGAFHLEASSLDSVMHEAVPRGGYTALLRSADGSEGEAIVELYNASHQSETRLVNLSTRLTLEAGKSAIPGFVIAEGDSQTLLVRAVGPGLADFGILEFLADPSLELKRQFDSSFAPVFNADWEDSEPVDLVAAFNATGAFPLKSGSKDAAMLVSLGPGAYTVRVFGEDNGSGTVLIEVFVANP